MCCWIIHFINKVLYFYQWFFYICAELYILFVIVFVNIFTYRPKTFKINTERLKNYELEFYFLWLIWSVVGSEKFWVAGNCRVGKCAGSRSEKEIARRMLMWVMQISILSEFEKIWIKLKYPTRLMWNLNKLTHCYKHRTKSAKNSKSAQHSCKN